MASPAAVFVNRLNESRFPLIDEKDRELVREAGKQLAELSKSAPGCKAIEAAGGGPVIRKVQSCKEQDDTELEAAMSKAIGRMRCHHESFTPVEKDANPNDCTSQNKIPNIDVHRLFKDVCGPDSVGHRGMYGTTTHVSLGKIMTGLGVGGKSFHDLGCANQKPGVVAYQYGAKSARGTELPENKPMYGIQQDAVRKKYLGEGELQWYNLFYLSIVFSDVQEL